MLPHHLPPLSPNNTAKGGGIDVQLDTQSGRDSVVFLLLRTGSLSLSLLFPTSCGAVEWSLSATYHNSATKLPLFQREREGGRERDRDRERERESVHVWARERERECVCVCMHVCVHVCVHMCVRESLHVFTAEREKTRKTEKHCSKKTRQWR